MILQVVQLKDMACAKQLGYDLMLDYIDLVVVRAAAPSNPYIISNYYSDYLFGQLV